MAVCQISTDYPDRGNRWNFPDTEESINHRKINYVLKRRVCKGIINAYGKIQCRKEVSFMFYEMTIAGLKRQLPLCKVTDNLYIGAFIMFSDVEITKACAAELLKKAPEFDIMITAESKGIPLLYEMARQAGVNDYVVARKGPKVYMDNIITTEVDSITTAHTQTLCIGQKEIDLMKGKRVLIVDDVISTGESLKSIETLVNKAGGNIVGRMAVLAEGEAADRDDIIFLEKLPVFNPDGTIK